jgi:shikimate kinase
VLIYLSGFMGSGKTTLAKRWSESFDGEYFDFDQEISRQLEIVPEELGQWIEHNGWEQFRALETELLKKTLTFSKGLFSLGGGTLSSDKNQALVDECDKANVFWLNTSVESCWARVKDESHRPLVKEGKDAFFSLYFARLAGYKKSKSSVACDQALEEVVNLSAQLTKA